MNASLTHLDQNSHRRLAADVVSGLDFSNPGDQDAAYLERRRSIADISLSYVEGRPVPRVDYTGTEDRVWAQVCRQVAPLHARLAGRPYREGLERLGFDRTRLPQLDDVNRRLADLTGFRMIPALGFVASRTFLSQLARRTFLATQYVRHDSIPEFTPEPDLVHELLGHGPTLSHPIIADLNQRFGEAVDRVGDEALGPLSHVYWFAMETAMVREGGEVKVLGQALLSSIGELEHIEEGITLLPFDVEVMTRTSYDPTRLQDRLFLAPDFETLVREVRGWLDALR